MDRNSSAVSLDFVFVGTLGIIAAVSVFITPSMTGPLRAASTLVFVLFAPGYAIVAALFPGRKTNAGVEDGPIEPEPDQGIAKRGGIDGLERIVFSVGISATVTVLVGVGLGTVTDGINPQNVLTAVLFITAVALIPAVVQRRQLAPAASPMAGLTPALEVVRAELFDTSNKPKLVFNLLVIVVVLGALGSITYGYDSDDDGLTEFYIMAENTDGEMTLGNYSETIALGEEREFTAVIDNQENDQVDYTLVVIIREEFESNGTVVIAGDRRLLTEEIPVSDGESERLSHTLSLSTERSVDRIRLTYLLYTDGVPETPSRENAYRELHLWLTVSE